jgi:hypothetical protein
VILVGVTVNSYDPGVVLRELSPILTVTAGHCEWDG